MQSGIKIEVALFGAFRKFSDKNPLVLYVPEGASLGDVKKSIGRELSLYSPAFNQHTLIEESALADEKEVLTEDFVIRKEASLAILPPVCGG